MYYIVKLIQGGNISNVIISCNEATEDKLEDGNVIKEKTYEYDNENIIYVDDTVENVKYKIKKILGLDVGLDELYLHYVTDIQHTSKEIFNILSQNGEIEITYERLRNYLANFTAFDLDSLETKDVYDLEDIITMKLETLKKMHSAIGLHYNIERKYPFVVNPYLTSSVDPIIESSGLDIVSTHNKRLLMEYGTIEDNTIYVCLAEDVLLSIDDGLQSYLTKLYFPSLAIRKLLKVSDIVSSRKTVDTSQIDRHNEKIHELNKLYDERPNDLDYKKVGISLMRFVIHPPSSVLIPLQIIFKIISTSPDQPVVKYNSSTKGEKLYRLYADKISTDGKRIPVLQKTKLTTIGQKYGRKKSVSVYYEADDIIVVLEFFSTGEIRVQYSSPNVSPISKIEPFLIDYINSMLGKINIVINKSGYQYRFFKGFQDKNIEILTINYQKEFIIPPDAVFDLSRYASCISPVFLVLQNNLVKTIEVEFKRVSYYNELNSVDKFIARHIQLGVRSQDIIELLMTNFEFTKDKSEGIITAFLQNIQVEQNVFENRKLKIRNTSGIPITIEKDKFTNNITIRVENLSHIGYLETTSRYIDILLRLSLDTLKPSSRLAALCSAKKETDVKIDLMEDVVAKPEQGIDTREDVDLKDGEVTFGDDDDGDDDLLDDFMGDDDDDFDEFDDLPEDGEGLGGSLESIRPSNLGGAKTPPVEELTTLDGMPLNNPNYFFERMYSRDPVLFLKKESGKFKPYSRYCPHNLKRQPVILTDEEKEIIDRDYPGSYPAKETFKYGSTKDKQHWYICPRYWCLRDNVSLTEADVKAGKCGGKVIPMNAKKVPKGHYIFEFNVGDKNNEHLDKEGNYIQHYPGFLKKDFHQKGLGVPCCFRSWDKGGQPARREHFLSKTKPVIKTPKATPGKTPEEKHATQYIHNELKFPLANGNVGYLPLSIQKMIGVNNDNCRKHKSDVFIKGNTPCLLRHGVENSENQSFLACISSFFNKKYGTSSVSQMKQVILALLTLDVFVTLQNGSLVAIFTDESNTTHDTITMTEFKKKHKKGHSILDKVKNKDYRKKVMRSFLHFVDFIESDETLIDHTYLWDFVSNHLFMNERDGRVNIILFEMVEDDITNKVDILCPTDTYSTSRLDTKYKNLFIIKRGQYYEPMSLFILEDKVIKTESGRKQKYMLSIIRNMFSVYEDDIDVEIKKTIHRVKDFQSECTRAKEVVYYEDSVDIEVLKDKLKDNKAYTIVSQVLNYNNKIIGLIIKKGRKQIFVPIKPTKIQEGVDLTVIDDDEIWRDYKTTTDMLTDVGKVFKLPCEPMIKVLEDGLIVGVLTKTNQFVSINPPRENIQDGLPEYDNLNYHVVDVDVHEEDSYDEEREKTIKRIKLESNFYTSFRNTVKILISTNPVIRRTLMDIIETPDLMYKKLEKLEQEIRKLSKPYVSFISFTSDTIDGLEDIGVCLGREGKEKVSYCFTKGRRDVLMLPKKHLISGFDNENIYAGRVADELLRYPQIRNYLLEDNVFLSLMDLPYDLGPNEIILLEKMLVNYFDALKYTKNNMLLKNTYDTVGTKDIADTLIEGDREEKEIELRESALCPRHTRNMAETDMNLKDLRGMGQITIVSMGDVLSVQCMYELFIDMIGEHIGKKPKREDLQRIIADALLAMTETNSDDVRETFLAQGKKYMFHQLKLQQTGIRELVMSRDYYLTNIDLFILCKHYNMSMVVISRGKLLETDYRLMSINNTSDTEFFYIVKQYGIKDNEIQKYEALQVNSSYQFDIGDISVKYREELDTHKIETPFTKQRIKPKRKKKKGKLVLEVP